jgi:hypothetical protein
MRSYLLIILLMITADAYSEDFDFPSCTPNCVFSNNDNETISPILYQDSETGNLYFVESDGRHITAFTAQGKMHWHRNPFEDARLPPYRVSKPVIVSIKSSQEQGRLLLTYSSSQFGWLDKVTGEFKFRGQN